MSRPTFVTVKPQEQVRVGRAATPREALLFTCGVVLTRWLLRGDLDGRRCWGDSSSSRNKRLLFELRVGWKGKRGKLMNMANNTSYQSQICGCIILV